jgi:hypothetical protein
MAKSKYEEYIDKNNLSVEEVKEIVEEKPKYIFDGKEKQYEEYIKENLQDICDKLDLPKIVQIEQQRRIDIDNFSVKPDLITIHEDGTISIFEIKCCNYKHPSTGTASQAQAIGQLLLYKNIFEEIRQEKVRVFLVDQKIFKRTLLIFSDLKLPITLMEVQYNRVFIPYRNMD